MGQIWLFEKGSEGYSNTGEREGERMRERGRKREKEKECGVYFKPCYRIFKISLNILNTFHSRATLHLFTLMIFNMLQVIN